MKITNSQNFHCIYFIIRQSFFPSKITPKNQDLSYKMGLDLWDCLGRVKLVLAKFHRTDLVNCSHSREGGNPFL